MRNRVLGQAITVYFSHLEALCHLCQVQKNVILNVIRNVILKGNFFLKTSPWSVELTIICMPWTKASAKLMNINVNVKT